MDERLESPRQPLLNMLADIPDHDLSLLFNVLDVARKAIIMESCQERDITDKFLAHLWIATRGQII